MIERPDHRTKLLADTVHGDWLEGPVADFARQAAAHARRRRRLRRTAQAAGVIACFIAGGLALYFRVPPPSHRHTTLQESKTRAYEIISDDELLAQLHDRPLLALKKENGTHEFVFLDH
jgi:hypothetical protein